MGPTKLTTLVLAVNVSAYSAVVEQPGFTEAPANDNFSDAETVTAVSYGIITGENIGSTVEAGEPRPCGLLGSTVWYIFLNLAPAPWAANTFDSGYDTTLAAYSGDAVSALTVLGCNDDAGGAQGLRSKVGFTAAPGATVSLQVGGSFGSQGTFNPNVYPGAAGRVLEA